MRINNNEVYGIKIYGTGTTRLVKTKELYDNIREGGSYKFTFEKISRLYYVTHFEEVENVQLKILESLTRDHFENLERVKVHAFIVGAYEFKLCTAGPQIKVVVCLKLDNDYVQCDLMVDLDGLTFLRFDTHDTVEERTSKMLSYFYNRLNKNVLIEAKCCKAVSGYQIYYKLALDGAASILDSDDIENFVEIEQLNISYLNKQFSIVRVEKMEAEIVEYINKKTNKLNKMIKLTITPVDSTKMIEACIFVNTKNQEDCVTSLQNVDVNVAHGEHIYCLMYRKPGDTKYVAVSVVGRESDNDWYTLFC
ncbi:lef-3 [Hyphantria cunea granulovirus]|uniref:Lef-3 n=1 Tax=Hyphantria cunea granulovirus TaxID=307448 RepID=A0AAE6D045_9BBAC|nr:lef-3 [Hyphantria cunea granulovirus]QBQ01652.1 lef-3 [Hyphantria cunea granulovirus]